jgi:DNA-binding transcriptional MerR regulator
MPDTPLLTLKQIADALTLPESTARYYRDAFPDLVPCVGTGRRRRYPKEAVAVLRSIADAYAAGRTRREIAALLGAGEPRAGGRTRRDRDAAGRGEVSNLDLLAALLDGEREQRDALWQMAGEIVRLTEVLDGQDRVLAAIADRAGVPLEPRPTLGRGARAALGAGAPDAAPRAEPPDAPDAGPTSEVERLRQALEAERTLVERLRQARLELERRAADAEADLEERRRSSLLRRIFRGDDRA